MAKVRKEHSRNRECSLEEKELRNTEFSRKSVAGKSNTLGTTEIITS